MDTRIFIGSSGESLGILSQVAACLHATGEIIQWTKAFVPNKSNLDSLIQQTRLSDFSILIAMKDDILTTRGVSQEVARDNIIFEFGLFLGAAGLRKSFLMAEEGINLPSDLDGITVYKFTQKAGEWNSLHKVCESIRQAIENNKDAGELGLLPSTALAIGYFNSFIKNLSQELHSDLNIYSGGQASVIQDFMIHVVVPQKMDDSGINDIRKLYNRDQKLVAATTRVTDSNRGFPFHFTNDVSSQSGLCHIHDVPTTLNTMQECIRMLIPQNSIGPNVDIDRLEERELNNFCRVLSYLIARNAATKNHVVIDRINN